MMQTPPSLIKLPHTPSDEVSPDSDQGARELRDLLRPRKSTRDTRSPHRRHAFGAGLLTAAEHPVFGKTSRTLGVMLLILGVPYAFPGLARWRVLSNPWAGSESSALVHDEVETPHSEAPALRQGETTLKASGNEPTLTSALPTTGDEGSKGGASFPPSGEFSQIAKLPPALDIEDPSGHAMDAFYNSLARTIRKESPGITRILHYGDSIITADYITGTIRRRLQARFGDAGHGFILTANPVEWYFHNDVSHKASVGWSSSRLIGPLSSDGLYGLGGASFRSTVGATAQFGTAERGEYGQKVSRFDVYYLEHEGGGRLELAVDGKLMDTLSTRGTNKVSRVRSVAVPDGPASLTIRAVGGGDVRVFGVALERDSAGIAVDALGLPGGRAALWEAMDKTHWFEQMSLRKPALIIVQYGTNESEIGLAGDAYQATLSTFVENLKAAAPESSILIAAPVDRAEKTDKGEIRTKEIIVRLTDAQRKVAQSRGVAFWNTFEAMGGRGTVKRWLFTKPNLYNWDFTHPTTQGAMVIGDLLVGALLRGYSAYEARTPSAPSLPSSP